MRSPAARPAAWWPAAGLLGLVIPLAFAERVQSYLHYLSPAELWPVFGTTVLLHLPFAAALWLVAGLLGAAWRRLPERLLDRLGGRLAVPGLLFAAVIAFGLHLGLQLWLAQVDPQGTWAARLPALRWWLLVALLGAALWPALRRGLANLVGAARALGLVGLVGVVTLPLFGWGDGRGGDPAPAPPAGKRPHLVLLTFDTLAAQHLSLYGYPRPTSPTLDRFAAEGVVFERFYANGNYTTPTVNSILSGRLPTEHRALQLHSWPVREARDDSLPALLRRAGYRTYAVSTNPLAGPYKNGYGAHFDGVVSDRIQTYFSGRDGPSRWLKYLGPVLDSPIINTMWRPIALAHWRYGDQQRQNRHYDPALAFDAARQLLDRHPGGPMFLWVHLLPPHSPYAAPEPFLGSFDAAPQLRRWDDSTPPFMFEWGKVPPAVQSLYRARYDESIRYVDAATAPFLDELLRRLGPDTVVAISADHGESFLPGYGGHAGPSLNEGMVRIPLIVRGPGFAAGHRSPQVASQIDLAPTFAALAGVAPSPAWPGRSLLPQLQGAAPDAAARAWTMNLEQNPRGAAPIRGSVALVETRWKYTHFLGRLRYPDMPTLADELHDLQADPAGVDDRAASQPDEAARLRAEIGRFVSGAAPR